MGLAVRRLPDIKQVLPVDEVRLDFRARDQFAGKEVEDKMRACRPHVVLPGKVYHLLVRHSVELFRIVVPHRIIRIHTVNVGKVKHPFCAQAFCQKHCIRISRYAWDGAAHHVIATEGGHTDFAPTTEQEIALLQFMMKKHPDHVSSERLISGEGLINIYQFLKTLNYAQALPQTEQQMTERDPAAVIGEAAIEGGDVLCVDALTLFCRLYGAESGNLALKCLPYAGIYLAGGIGAKILPFLNNGEFMRGFLAKGRYRPILQKISVKVCTNSEVGLLGALSYAQKRR